MKLELTNETVAKRLEETGQVKIEAGLTWESVLSKRYILRTVEDEMYQAAEEAMRGKYPALEDAMVFHRFMNYDEDHNQHCFVIVIGFEI